jgi:integrase/recombinase XerD
MDESSTLINKFLQSRRQGLSPRTLEFYQGYLDRAKAVVGLDVGGEDIHSFLANLQCSNGGKHAYFRTLRAFYNWLYSPKSQFQLNPNDNPMLAVDGPKVPQPLLPAPTQDEVDYLIDQTKSIRLKTIVSLFADSGVRLNELANLKPEDINWVENTITVWGKGNKQRKAAFSPRTTKLLKEFLSQNGTWGDNIWSLKARGIQACLERLTKRTGVACNAHSLRRGFASSLHRAGLDVEHIMRLGGWQSLAMVLRYTRSVKFEDSLQHYQALMCREGNK